MASSRSDSLKNTLGHRVMAIGVLGTVVAPDGCAPASMGTLSDAPVLAMEQMPERVVLQSGDHLAALKVDERQCRLLLSSQTVELHSATDAF